MAVQWRNYTTRLSLVSSKKDYDRFDKLYRFLNNKYQELQNNPDFRSKAKENIGEYKTNFVRAMNNAYGKPYLGWDISNPAKYYRIVLTQVRENLKSFVKKEQLAIICEQYNWDCSNNKIKEIQKTAHDVLGYYPKYRDIANICQSQSVPLSQKNIVFELDYSSEDDQICKITHNSKECVIYALKIDNNERMILNISLPKTIREHKNHYSRPNIIPIFEDDVIIDYKIMVSYEPVIIEHLDNNGILGVDLGKIKAVSMIALYPDDRVSREFLATRETQKVLEKLNNVYNETKSTQLAIRKCQSKHLITLENELSFQRAKLSRLRLSFARLVARDICSAALELKCKEVHLEDLARLIATGSQITGRWNFAEVKRAVMNECALHNIKVILISPTYTSKTNPFDNTEVEPDNYRSVDCGAIKLDRDYIAALNIARAVKNKKCRNCDVIDLELNIDNLLLSAVRVKLLSRKKDFKKRR